MDLSIFLGKLFGLYLMIASLMFFWRPYVLHEAVDNFFKSHGLILFSGALLTFFGLGFVLAHSVWELNWRGLLTLIGYFMLLKGLARLFFPTLARDIVLKICHTNGRLYVGGVTFFIGLYLSIASFTASVL